MRIISDAMLARGARAPLGAVRLAAARRAAARQLHEIALAGAPDDPMVLALLGMHRAALAAPARDKGGAMGRLLAESAFGRAPDEAALGGIDAGWRWRIASALAPHDPRAAAAILPAEDRIARAACLWRAGDPLAETLLEGIGGAEAEALRTGFAIDAGDFAGARASLNRMFAATGLAPPLAQGAAAFGIETLAGAASGQVEGPLVSMIMPVRDNADTIGTAIGSLTRQGWRALEILVIDDGSVDDSVAVARRLAEADGRIRVVANAGPSGVAGARNTGIAQAKGRWIGFLDADDWSHPDRIARQVARLGAGAATYSRHIRMDAEGRPMAPRVFPIVRLCTIGVLADAGALRAAGPFEIARTGSDAEMLARLDVRYGRAAVPRDPAIHIVASWRPRSLSNDGALGLVSPDRFAYREDWMRRHVGLGRLPLPARST